MTEDKIDNFVGQFGHTYDEVGAADWLFEITGFDEDRGAYELRTISGMDNSETICLIKRGDMVKHHAGGGIALYATLDELQRATQQV